MEIILKKEYALILILIRYIITLKKNIQIIMINKFRNLIVDINTKLKKSIKLIIY